jgi:hypothetical protein
VEETEPDDEDMVELHVVQADDIKREKGTRPSSSDFFHSGHELFSILDPGNELFSIPYPGSEPFFSSRFRIKEFKYHKPKKLFLSSRVVYPGSGILIFYPSRIQVSKRHRIPDPDSQHWFIRCHQC